MVQFIIEMVFIAFIGTIAVIGTNPELRQMVGEWLEEKDPQNSNDHEKV